MNEPRQNCAQVGARDAVNDGEDSYGVSPKVESELKV